MFARLLLNSIEKKANCAVHFIPKRCLRSRLSGTTCNICLSQCGKQAISSPDGRVCFEEDICTSCMACVTACPNDAFACDFDMAPVLKALHGNNGKDPVVLSCQPENCHANYVPIPCIGFFSEPLLAALNCAAKHDFFIDVHRCANCDNSHQLKILEEKVQGVIANVGLKNRIKIHFQNSQESDPNNIGLQRRFFLQTAKKSLMSLSRELSADCGYAKKEEQIKTGEKGPVLVFRFLQMTFDMLQEENISEKDLLLSYFNTITTSEVCDLCPACTGMCPTGALKRTEHDGKKKLVFTSAKCSGCGLCCDFCKKQALTLRQGFRDNPKISLQLR